MLKKTEAAAKSDKWKNWLNGKAQGKDLIWVLILYAAEVLIRFLIANFPKTICIYNDELLYYSIAQSIYSGKGIMCLNASVPFGKLMYSFVLAPFFGIEDTYLRMTLITLFNTALIMTSLILVYLICKELEINRAGIIPIMVITALWPDFLYSMSFMAENLNWPLALLAILLWIKIKNGKNIWLLSVLLGFISCIGFLCKDIFLAFTLCCVLYEIVQPIISYLINRKGQPPKKLKEYYNKNSLICCGIMVAIFVLCCAAVSFLISSSGIVSSAEGTVNGAVSSTLGVVKDLARLKDPYTFFYLIYAFVYLLASSLIALMVIPVVYPAVGFKRTDNKTQGLYLFLALYLIISCGIIACTVSIREDIGSTVPRVHLRYIGFILLSFIIVFFKLLQENTSDAAVLNRQGRYTILASLFSCLIFKGCQNKTIDQTMLNLYFVTSQELPRVSNERGDKLFYPASVVFFIVLVLIALITHYYGKRGKASMSATLFCVFMCAVCFKNSQIQIQKYSDYKLDASIGGEVAQLNDYFDKTDEAPRILFICNNYINEYSKSLTSHFKYQNNTCYMESLNLKLMSSKGIIDVPNTELFLNMNSFMAVYPPQSGFDYIITDCDIMKKPRGVSKIEGVCGEYFTLYKNINPQTIEIE